MAGAGSLAITVAAWFALAGLGRQAHGAVAPTEPQADPAVAGDPALAGSRGDAAPRGRPTSVESARGCPPRSAWRRRPFDHRAPCLHRHRLEHDAVARRGLPRRGAGRDPPGKSFHPRAASVDAGEEIATEKFAEVVSVVAAQIQKARDLGAADVLGVATAAVRWAGTATRWSRRCAVVRDRVGDPAPGGGGATGLHGRGANARPRAGRAARRGGVGGGSSELVVGTVPDQVTWFASFELGSGELADRCLHSDPPSAVELDRARGAGRRGARRRAAPAGRDGGRGGRQRHIAPPDRRARARCSRVRAGARRARRRACPRRGAALRARRRPREAPSGRVADSPGAAERFGAPLEIARGGLREGVLLEASRVA